MLLPCIRKDVSNGNRTGKMYNCVNMVLRSPRNKKSNDVLM